MSDFDKQSFLDAFKPGGPVPFETPNGCAYIRVLTVGERDRWEKSLLNKKRELATENIRASLLCLCLCGPDGARLYVDADLPKLAALDSQRIEPLFDKCREVNGMMGKEVEELQNFSGGIPESVSSTNSP